MNEPVWYRRNRDESDRFARLVDSADTHDDHEFSDELAVVSALRELGSQPALDRSGRDRILAAIEAKSATALADTPDTAEDITDTADVAETSGSVSEPTRHSTEALRHRQKRKASLLAAATAASIVAAGALGIELSQTAIPGDLLYDLKRTTESIALDLTFSDEGRARKHIEIASTRIDELTALVERDDTDGGVTAAEASDYRSLLVDLDRSAITASRVITNNADETNDRSDLTMLRDWAMRAGDRLAALNPSIPDSVANWFGQSTELVRGIEDRAVALLGRTHCTTVISDESDVIGPLPATGQCDATGGREQVAVQPKASSESTKAEKSGPGAASPLPQPEAPKLDAPERTSKPKDDGDDTADEPLTVPELPEPSLPDTDEEPVEESSEAGSPGIPLLPELEIG